jgi:hypothetical protein
MKWDEFKSMPDDIKATYINLIRQKFNAPVTMIAQMMGVTETSVRRELLRLNMTDGKKRSGKMHWDKEGFYAWVHGVDKLPTPVPAEEPIEEPIQEEQLPVITSMEPEVFVEDDLPFEEPKSIDPLMEKCIALDAENELLKHRIDELMKENEELRIEHTADKDLISWQRIKLEESEIERVKLKAQMEVVQLIFGGKNHG